MTLPVFLVMSAVAVVAALGLLFARKSVHAALGMALAMLIVGVLYLAQGAVFLGVVHVFVYAGAVMMMFLFVVMLVGVDAGDSLVETLRGQQAAAAVLTLALAGLLASMVGQVRISASSSIAAINEQPGNVIAMAYSIFGRYVWVFEATSALLITAAIGAMVLAHRERLAARPTQREFSDRRFRVGQHVAGLPAPGVYARHNAVDTPALLPDGTPSELSVNRVLRARGQVSSPARYLGVGATRSAPQFRRAG